MRRTVHRFRNLYLGSIAALVGVSLAIACGTEVTIPDLPITTKPVLDGSVPDTSVEPDGSVVTEDGGIDAADVVCPDVFPDDATGIFATPTGNNTATCGTRAAPCKTLSHSVTRAGAAFRTKVYAARGTYVERLTLAAGVEVIGGWDVTGTTWKRTCVSPEEAVIVRAPAGQNITVEARDLGGEAKLSLLRIESKPAAQATPGESLYGVVAVGTTTTVTLENVRVEMADAPAGASGAKGDAGTPAPASCAAGTGAAGAAGTQGPGAPAGSYDPTNGYAPGTATAGGAATPGANGPAGTAGTCVTCGTCAVSVTLLSCDFTPTVPDVCGTNGTNGCGGGAGDPGAPATGGGSNIGVFAWDATVMINNGKIKSGNAGNGGAGGPGGVGGAATKGAAGTAAGPCVVGCTFAMVDLVPTCTNVMGKPDAGAAGDAGGAGGLGGAGGGGGGGSSFAIYQGGAGLVTTAGGTTLVHGKAGTGGTPAGAGLGAAGVAADRIP